MPTKIDLNFFQRFLKILERFDSRRGYLHSTANRNFTETDLLAYGKMRWRRVQQLSALPRNKD